MSKRLIEQNIARTLYVVMFLLCAANFSWSNELMPLAPSWFGTLTAKPSRVVGYGYASTLQQATLAARENAASQLGVEVHSTTSRKITDDNHHVSSVSEVQSEATVRHKLNNTVIFREERIEDIYYVAVEADIRGTDQRISEELIKTYRDFNGFSGPAQLIKSPLMKSVSNQITLSSKSKLQLPVKLYRQGNDWMMRVGGINVILDSGEFFNAVDWTEGSNNKLYIQGTDLQSDVKISRAHNGQTFYFKMPHVLKNYFYTIYNVYSDGRVTLLAENLTGETSLEFPSRSDRIKGIVLEAAKTNEATLDTDTYLVVESKSKLHSNRILSQGARVVEQDNSYSADLLLDLFSDTAVVYGVTTILIE